MTASQAQRAATSAPIRSPRRLAGRIAAASLLLACGALDAMADEEFYKGRTVTLLIAFQAGSGYDTYGRALARHMHRYIPGGPTIVVSNMTGGGGLVVANHLYNVAPKDGSVFGIFSRSNNLDHLFGTPEAKFDPRNFSWIGSMGDEVSVCISWHKSPVKRWDDLIGREFVAASTANSADTGVYPALFNAMLGTRIKVINGYKGGPEMSKAIEDGEVDGRCGWSWTAVKATKPDWIQERKINLLVQAGLAKAKDLPDVPLGLDLAKSPRQRQALELAFLPQGIAWGFAAPPGIPPARLEALRKAFLAALADRDFLAEAKKLELGIDPMPGPELAKQIARLYEVPKDLVAEVRQIMQPLQK